MSRTGAINTIHIWYVIIFLSCLPQDTITCSITGSTLADQFFDIDADTCLIKIETDLTTDTSRTTEYGITVLATDGSQTASAEVFVTVLRDLFQPQFTNLPTSVSVDEDVVSNTTIFTALATDADLQVIVLNQ